MSYLGRLIKPCKELGNVPRLFMAAVQYWSVVPIVACIPFLGCRYVVYVWISPLGCRLCCVCVCRGSHSMWLCVKVW